MEGAGAELHQAIKKKDKPAIKRLAERADLSYTDADGKTALHIAAAENDADTLKLLLKVKGKPELNLPDKHGATPLMCASEHGAYKSAEALIKSGADPTKVTEKGTVLHVLLSAKRWVKDEKKILKMAIPLMKDKSINKAGPSGETALQMACMKGQFDTAILLLKQKADPTIVEGGEPPLFGAVNAENTKLLKALLEHGADIGQGNSKAQSLIELINPKSEMYKLIKKHVLTTPGGERKMRMASEDYAIATKVEDLPQDLKRLVNASKITYDKIAANWEVFCSIIYFVGKKRIFATEEELQKFKASVKKENKSTAVSATTQRLTSDMVTPGNPKKFFKSLQITGRGGFGMVFAGTAPDKSRVAIKRMPHTSEREKRANLREAWFLKTCTHPNICGYKATYECQELHELWVIMELLEGGNLDEAISEEDSAADFQEKHIAYVARETLTALLYLHERKIAHRDLKAPNVMLDVEGRIKLIDFGLAVEIEPDKLPTDMCGSPYWMPPEMIMRQPHSFPVDIWSMAICLLELANKHPPDNDSALRAMFLVATKGAPRLDKPEQWSDIFKDFLDCCLQLDPTRRGTAEQLLKHRFIAKACKLTEMQQLLRGIFASYRLDQISLV